MRILIASDNRALTSEQQFAPLLANRGRIADELGVIFEQQLIDDLLAGSGTPSRRRAAAVLAKLSFLTPEKEAMEKLARLRELFPVPMIYFDGDDDSCVQWSGLLDLADVIVKKHMFADLSWYQKRFHGKNNLTDYVAREHGWSFADNVITQSGIVPPEKMHKVVLGYNIGMDDKITTLFHTTKPAGAAEKTVDVMCRAACTPDKWIYPLRAPIQQALQPLEEKGYNVLVPNQRVDQQGYYQEMRSSRISISPFGYGEICWRDFEAILMGSLLVKPDMSHIRTEPDIFVPGETYVPVRWDFSDLAETCERYLVDEQARNNITQHAYQVLAKHYASHAYLPRLRAILTGAGVLPFAEARN